MTRRSLAALLAAVAGAPGLRRFIGASRAAAAPNLRSAPLRVSGDWGQSLENTARLVVSRMRDVCLAGLALLSDRQPRQLDVDAHRSGFPHVELGLQPTDTAFIVVDIGTRAWAQLAYQFGHELGHVLCNSWLPGSVPRPPCQWLEEALVEAFSLRGLGLLADSWARDPVVGDAAYGPAIEHYRDNQIEKYRTGGPSGPVADIAAWFRANRGALDGLNGMQPVAGPAVVAFHDIYERDNGCIEDLGAVNRWPERSAVPLETYLRLWEKSCREIKAPGRMPERVREILGLR